MIRCALRLALGVPLLLSLMPSAAWSATEVEALNREWEALTAQGSEAERDVTRLLRRKLEDRWKLSPESARARVQPFAKGGYRVRLDAACSGHAERLIGTADAPTAYRGKLREQAQQAALFLADFHGRLLGQPTTVFEVVDVRLCTDSVVWTPNSRPLQYDRFRGVLTVRIGPRVKLLGRLPGVDDNLNPLDREALLKRWNDGEHWDESPFHIVDHYRKQKSPLRAYWPYIDPVGGIRTGLRELIRREGLVRAQDVAERAGKREWDGLFADLGKLVTGKALAALDARVRDERGALDSTRLEGLLGGWRGHLESPAAAEAMGLAHLVALEKQATRDMNETQIRKTQIGLVNVENFHQVFVDATIGEVTEYEKVIVVPQKLVLDVKQVGLVNVSTGDDVRVRAFLALLFSSRRFEEGALKRALAGARPPGT